MDAYATINDMWEISWNTGYLLSNIYMGIGEIAGMGYDTIPTKMVENWLRYELVS